MAFINSLPEILDSFLDFDLIKFTDGLNLYLTLHPQFEIPHPALLSV